MPTLEFIRSEIERMRAQIERQRKEIIQLQRGGLSTAAAETLLLRMQGKVEQFCAQRDALRKDEPGQVKDRVLGGRKW